MAGEQHLVEPLHPLVQVESGSPRGQHADHISGGLELDLDAGLDPLAVGDGLGNGDL